MLKSLVEKLACPTCKDTQRGLDLHVFRDGNDGHVADGVLTCRGCGVFYPIENDLLELVPPALLDPAALPAFLARFSAQLSSRGISAPAATSGKADEFSEQLAQRRHFDDFASGAMPDYTKTAFIRAASRRYINIWKGKLPPGGAWILDIGCGTGISSFPFADANTVVGFDISKKVIAQDIEAAKQRRLHAKTTFFVGDGSFLAFKNGSFNFSQTFGVLHHLPNPPSVVREIQRILAPGGLHFAVENNKSMFRGAFDAMMKLKPLWIEEAGEEPLMSRQMVDDWCAGLPVKVDSETSIFLPPHLVNILPQRVADAAVEYSDRLFSLMPILRQHGGQLVFTIGSLSRP